MRFKKIFFIVIAFMSVFFYGSSKDTESIHSISSKKAAELNLKVTKKKSIEEPMYIDRDNKRVFYFFGNDGLFKNDFINVTEKLSTQEGKSKTFSKQTNNMNEVKISNKSQDENLDYLAEKGDIKNRVIVNYKNEPKNLYVEFYEGIGKLKKVIKNRYIALTRKKIYGRLDKEKQEITVDFVKNNSSLEELLTSNEKLEIIGISSAGAINILEYESLNIEQVENNVQGSFKIKLKNPDDELYLTVYDSFSNLKEAFVLELENENSLGIFNRSNEMFKGFFKWNSPLVDITEWTRKTFKLRTQNKDFYYGEETFLGETIPYVDINVGEIVIPVGDPSIVGEAIELKSHSDEKNRGKVLLKNNNGEFIEGVLYFKTDLAVDISEVKGKNNEPIEGATSQIIYKGLKEKKTNVRLRVYDRKADEESIFIEGLTEYINNRVSDNTIEIKFESNILYTDNTVPPVEFVDTRDSLRENLKLNKRLLDFTYDTGVEVGKDLNWSLANRFVDVRLAEVVVDNFEDRVAKLKDPYIEIDTQNEVSTGYLEVGTERINPYRYYIRLESGKGLDENKISEGDFILGYDKILTTIENGKVNELKGDVVVRLLAVDYLKIKNSGESTLNFKNADGTAPKMKLVLNADYPDRAYEVSLDSYNVITAKADKEGKEVNLKMMLALREIKENMLNLVFDLRNNTSGDIALRGNGQHIENGLGKLSGLSVFDMSGEPMSQTYDSTDTLSIKSPSGMTVIGDTGATFEADGYKGIKFKQTTTNIEYEVRFWNNTKKIEIMMDKTKYSGSGQRESSGVIEVLDKDGKSKLKVNLVLNASQIDKGSNIVLMRGEKDEFSELMLTEPFVYSPEWNAEISKMTASRDPGGVDLVINSFKTFTGDKILLQSREGINEHGLSQENFVLKASTTTTTGTIENGAVVLNSSGAARAKLEGVLTKEQRDNIWRSAADQRVPKLNVMELVFAYGKRRIPQWIALRDNTAGSLDAYIELETKIIDNKQPFRIGQYYFGKQTAEVLDENDKLYLEIELTDDAGDYVSLETKEFKDKDIDLRFKINGSLNTRTIEMYIDDIVLSKTQEDLGVFRIVRPDNEGQERNKHKIIVPKYNPIDEAYSPLSSLQTVNTGEGKVLTEKLEIVRDRLDDSSSTLGIVKDLGSVGLLGRDSVRKSIINRNSTTMNYMKLPNRVVLQKAKNGTEKSSVTAELSFSPTVTNDKDFLQIAELDQEKHIYLHIAKLEAEKLEPGVIYSLVVEYDAKRIAEESVEGRSIAYIGLKTDKTSDLGLDEYIYDSLYQLNLQTEIAQDTSVKLYMDEDKPLIKSGGNSNLMRIYLSEAKYSTDVVNPDNYSSLTMRGLLTPYEYDKVEYGTTHNMRVRLEGESSSITIPLSNTSGGQGVLKTAAGDIYIGYLSNPDLQAGTVAGNPLEILTLGMKGYNFRGGAFKVNIEHLDPTNPSTILTEKSFTVEVPRFLPKKWYFNVDDSLKLNEETSAVAKYIDGNKLIYPLGNVSLYADRDLSLTKTLSDLFGVRIVYDESIELENKDSSSNKIQGKIVRIDSSGSVLSKQMIYTTPTQLAIEIDTAQSSYMNGSTYIYRDGSVDDISADTNNKLIRIGRKDHWEGLIKSVELKSLADFTWNNPRIDITAWDRKTFKSRNQNREFYYGEEKFLGGTIPYIDIDMGEVVSEKEALISGVRLKKNDGNILLSTKNGEKIEGRLYFTSNHTSTMTPIMGKNNEVIADSTQDVTFKLNEEKKANIRLRVYDRNLDEESVFIEGITEYMSNRVSDNTIEVKYESSTVYTDNTVPPVEFVDTRDSLKENLKINKRLLDFTYDAGEEIGKDLNWALANRFVDVRLAEVVVNNFEDKVGKLKEPYIEVDTQNGVSTGYLEVGTERINPYRYYIRLESGRGLEEDKISEGDFIIGYNKISAPIEDGKVNELKGDIVVRLLVADYLKIKNSGENTLNFKNENGSAPKVKLVLNSDYPDKSYEVNLDNYNLITLEGNKLGKTVDLKVLLALSEIKENELNLVFDAKNNMSGNIALRGNGQHIENGLGKLEGLSVFDIKGEPISQTYKETDTVSIKSSSGDIISGDVGATFEVDGYKGVKFKQPKTNIEFEVRFWNNTKKIEITMDKSNYLSGSSQESKVKVEVLDKNSNSKLALNLVLNASLIEYGDYMKIYPSEHLSNSAIFVVDDTYTYSTEWNTEIVEVTGGRQVQPSESISSIDIGVTKDIPTYSGDEVYIQIKDIIDYGLTSNNFYLEKPLTHVIGEVRDNKLYLNKPGSSGRGRANIKGTLTKKDVETIWRGKEDYYQPKINAYEIVIGNGKRRIPQVLRMESSRGSSATYVELESKVTDPRQKIQVGSYYETTQSAEVYDENENKYLEVLPNAGNMDYPSLMNRNFRGKEIDLRFEVYPSTTGNVTNFINMFLDDIVLSKTEELFGIFRVVRPDTGGQERNMHTIIIPKYNPIDEAYSPMSSLPTVNTGEGKEIADKLEIVRDRLDDPSTTQGIVKDLGSVELLGRNKQRKDIIGRNSTTMNSIKLPDRVMLQKSKSGVDKSSIVAELSFSPTDVAEKDFLQVTEMDNGKRVYLHIEKKEAEKLEPGTIYSLMGEYNPGRISESSVEGRSIAYIGLKTDNTADLGLDEYIYDSLFKLNLQTEMGQDTSVKLFMSEDKPLIKSNGNNHLARVYLSGATYSTDISNPESYSSLTMRGLLTPYEYDKVEYGTTHNMVVTELTSGNKVEISVNKTTGGQGVLKTVAGDIYIGYLNNSELQNGTVAGNPLEILTLGMKEYNFRDGSLQIEIEHKDPTNPVNILTKESFSLEIPRFLPKKWYYNAEDNLKMEEEATGSVRYVNGTDIIYPLGNVSLYGDRDLELTKTTSDALGMRIEYDEDIELENKDSSSNKIQGKIVRIDSSGNVLSKEAIYTIPTKLAVVIDTTQSGYSNGSSYIYRDGNIDDINGNKDKKLIRIGREGYWEGLIKSIELKRISQGDFTLNYDFNYPRGNEIEFNETGKLNFGAGAYVSIKGEFINNIPNVGKVTVFKYVSDDNLYGEKLGEVNITGGKLEAPLEIAYRNGIDTTYSMVFNKIMDNVLNVTLNYWQEGIFNDRIVIRVEDKNGITAIYKMNLRDFDNKSVLTIQYDNSQLGAGVLPDDLVNSLYFGSILNPNSFNYNDQRGIVESLNKLKITYYGKDVNIHDTIGKINLVDKNIIFTDDSSNEIVIEDTSIHRVYKRELVTPEGDALYEEGFKLRGYFNPRTNAAAIDGRYRGTLRVNIEIY